MAGSKNKPKGFRFFSPESLWNTPIPPNVPVHPASAEMVAVNFNEPPGIWVNRNYWTVPVYFADKNTPAYDVECIYGKAHGDRPTLEDPSGKEFIVHTDRGVILKDVPIPDDALPDSAIALRPEINADAHLCIVDISRRLEWDFCWMARKPSKPKRRGSPWFAGQGVVFRTDGNGLLANFEGSARGSGFPLTAGLIFKDEIEAGVIEHALALALHPAGKGHVYPPASVSDGVKKPGVPKWGIPEGALVQLDPSLNLNGLNLDNAARTIAHAMQKYGMYVCDCSGGINLYAEGFPFVQPNPWDGVMAIDSPCAIPVKHLRVIDWSGRFFAEKKKPHNQKIFHDNNFFPPLPPGDAAKVLDGLNALRQIYKLPPYKM